MKDIFRNKWVLYGGAAALALGGVYLIYNYSTSSNAATTATGQDMSYAAPIGYGSMSAPLFASGTGTTSTDLGTTTDTSSATLDYLNSLSAINMLNANNTAAYNTASLQVQQQLGLANVDSVNRANDLAAQSAEAQSLASLAQSVVDTTARAKLAGSSGQAQVSGANGNVAVSFDVANLSRNPKQNLSLVSAVSGKSSVITLPSGSTLRGPNIG